jgi:hypothetical protein
MSNKSGVIGKYDRSFVGVYDKTIYIIARTGGFATNLAGHADYSNFFYTPNTRSKYQEASGKEFKQYTMKELFDLQIELDVKWGYVLQPEKYGEQSLSSDSPWWKFW